MIHLSERLQKIADNINEGETMADIGTDHGFLPIYLIQSGKSQKVIMTDISEASLMKAKLNSRSCTVKYAGTAEFRNGSGLEVLRRSEVDTVVIAGMGGKLITEIMAADIRHTCSFKKFIMQPRIGQGILRKFLLENGFTIVKEDLVKEGRHIPEIITALSPAASDDFLPDGSNLNVSKGNLDLYGIGNEPADHVIYRVPPWIINSGPIAGEFLTSSMDREKEKLKNIMLSNKRDLPKEESVCEDIAYLKKLKKDYERMHENGNQKKDSIRK